MKRIIGLTTAALLSASMFAAPAMAIDLNAGASGGVDVQAGGTGVDSALDAQTDLDTGTNTTMPDVDMGTTAAVGATFDSAVTAIEGSAATTQSIATMTEVSDVRIVSVSDLEGHDATAVERAVSENEAGIEDLRAAVDANAALSQEIEAQGVESERVIAAHVEADGAVTVFVE